MSLKKWIGHRLVLSFFVSAVSFAGGVEEGEKLCQALPFASDQMRCLTEVHKGHFYQSNVLEICKTFPFQREQIDCIEKIRNKSYTETLVGTCKNMVFSSKVLECLGQFGTPEVQPVVIVPPPSAPFHAGIEIGLGGDSKRDLRRAMRRALREMDRGRFYEARRTLETALNGYGE